MLVAGKLVEDAPLNDLLRTDRHCAQITGMTKTLLAQQDGIHDVEHVGGDDYVFRLEHPPEATAKALFQLAERHGAQLVSFHPEVVRLESIFEERMATHRRRP